MLCAVEKYNLLTITLNRDIPTDLQVWEEDDDDDIDYWPECLARLLSFHKQLDMSNPKYEKIPIIEINFENEWNAWIDVKYKILYEENEKQDGTTFIIGVL